VTDPDRLDLAILSARSETDVKAPAGASPEAVRARILAMEDEGLIYRTGVGVANSGIHYSATKEGARRRVDLSVQKWDEHTPLPWRSGGG
jgi:hypothetical protein